MEKIYWMLLSNNKNIVTYDEKDLHEQFVK